MHNLLKRQLKKYLSKYSEIPEELREFISAIDETYQAADLDRELLERSLELSSNELISRNSEMRAIFQAIPDLLFRIDRRGLILEYKGGAKSDFIISPSKLIGKMIYDVPSKEVSEKLIKAIDEVNNTEKISSFEYQLSTDKKQMYYEARLIPLNSNELIILLRNISETRGFQNELEKTKALLSSAIDQSPAGILIADAPNIHSILVNKAALNLLSIKDHEVLNEDITQPLHCCKMYYPDGKTLFAPDQHPLYLAIKKGIVSTNTESIIFSDNGCKKWISSNAGPVFDSNGKIIAGIIVFSDITPQKEAEIELINAKNKAEEMNLVKTNFLSNMSHELRTPLNGILGFTEILKSELTDSKSLLMVYNIYYSAKRLSQTLNIILDLSQIEKNKVSVVSKVIDLIDLIKNLINMYSIEIEKKNLTISTSYFQQTIILSVDEHLLSQVINNLLSNAVKYTETGGIQIIVTKVYENERYWLNISIKDTGIGISSGNLFLIFQEFRQVSEGLNRSFEGTGLGLTIAKRFSELLGGSLSVNSRLNEGSTFTVKLPYNDKAFAPIVNKVENQADQKEIKKKVINDKPSILYVEDDFISREMVASFLNGLCDLDLAVDSKTCLQKINEKHFDLILMDINLGKGDDGISTTKQIRKMVGYEKIPIVAITAYATENDRIEFLSAGCSHYLSKPFTKEQLLNILTKTID